MRQYLQAYADEEQSNWAAMLHAAEFAYNNSRNSTLGCTPFYALYGFNPQIHYDAETPEGSKAADAQERIAVLKTYHEKLAKRWQQAVETQAKHYNKRHKDITFRPDDLVMLSTANLNLRLPGKKFAPRFIGPLRIREPVGSQAYRLWMPSNYSIHNVFNVSRLERYNAREHGKTPQLPPAILLDGEPEWKIEKILAIQKMKGKTQYKVRWKGRGSEYDEWVAEDSIPNAREMIDRLNQEAAAKQAPRKRGRPKKNTGSKEGTQKKKKKAQINALAG